MLGGGGGGVNTGNSNQEWMGVGKGVYTCVVPVRATVGALMVSLICFQISILDSKRGMNVGIFLKQFKK